jgi:ESS family glutamate:Na+ symporter
MAITSWQFFVDFGVASLLLLFGLLLRSKIPIVQRLFLPACVTGGLAGLALGPECMDVLPLSGAFSTYPGILIALIFATLPFSSPKVELKKISGGIFEMWAYSSSINILQWGMPLLFSLLILNSIWPNLNPGFGTILVSGFVGGHGTAAAIGTTFDHLGWSEAASLAMTSATVGILTAIIGGMAWINWGASKGYSGYIKSFDDLSPDFKRGLISQKDQGAICKETVSGSTIDSLIFHFCIIGTAALGSYYLSKLLNTYFPEFKIPAFCLAYIVAYLMKALFSHMGILRYIDRRTVSHLGGSMTDLLVVFGIASIKISILVKYAFPLFLLFCFGIILCWVLFRFSGPQFFSNNWFEKSIFTWGWVTGIVAMGIALLRIVDPENKSNALGDYALAYLIISPIEIGLVTFGPLVISSGYYWQLAAGTILIGMIFPVYFFVKSRKPAFH